MISVIPAARVKCTEWEIVRIQNSYNAFSLEDLVDLFQKETLSDDIEPECFYFATGRGKQSPVRVTIFHEGQSDRM